MCTSRKVDARGDNVRQTRDLALGHGFHMRRQGHAERSGDTKECRQTRIAILAQSLVQGLSRHPRLARNLRHTPCSRDHAQSLADIARVATGERVVEQFFLCPGEVRYRAASNGSVLTISHPPIPPPGSWP
jgi:hypothetical protein